VTRAVYTIASDARGPEGRRARSRSSPSSRRRVTWIDVFDVAVIGSGYGGAVIAARLAPLGKVLLAERGGWWQPGQFPDRIATLARARVRPDNPGGLWGVRLGAGTGLDYASAFGGSSAVNYGITAQPDDHAFAGWPTSATELAPWFARARAALGATANPLAGALADGPVLDELEPGARIDLENTIDWSRCDRCGMCVPGCNRGAKRSLDRTYLADAVRAGLDLRVDDRDAPRARARRGSATAEGVHRVERGWQWVEEQVAAALTCGRSYSRASVSWPAVAASLLMVSVSPV
jgi:cholesterol oxidase